MAFTKTQVDEQIEGTYAEIYTHEGVTPQTIATGAAYTKANSFLDDGVSQGCTADSLNDKITITKTGTYKVECSLSFTGLGVNVNWFGSIFVDGVEQDKIHFERKINTGGDYGSTQFGGLVTIASEPIDIDVRFRHDSGTDKDITVRYANLNINRVGVS